MAAVPMTSVPIIPVATMPIAVTIPMAMSMPTAAAMHVAVTMTMTVAAVATAVLGHGRARDRQGCHNGRNKCQFSKHLLIPSALGRGDLSPARTFASKCYQYP
jgi:hypothetical protein